jgi:hypothetical protein
LYLLTRVNHITSTKNAPTTRLNFLVGENTFFNKNKIYNLNLQVLVFNLEMCRSGTTRFSEPALTTDPSEPALYENERTNRHGSQIKIKTL